MALDNLWIVERVKNNPLYKKCSVNLNQILVMEVFQIVCFEIFLQQNINKNPSCGAANCVKYARIWVFLCPAYSSLTIESKILSLNGNARVIHSFIHNLYFVSMLSWSEKTLFWHILHNEQYAFFTCCSTFSWRRPLSCRNGLTMGWFPYDRDLHHEQATFFPIPI